MKKTILMAVAALMATLSVSAQDEKHEIGVFYGIESISNVASFVTSGLAASVGDQGSFWGPVGVEYYYHVSPVVAVGGVAEIAGCKAENEKTKSEDFSEKFITVMPSVKFNWLRKKSFGMYSGLSAGAMFVSLTPSDAAKAQDSSFQDESITIFMFQATALGVEFGGKVRGFAEVGAGEKGYLCTGLRYKF